MPFSDRHVGNGQNCTHDRECDYLACQGACHPITATCQGQVLNNNLQVVCEEVFLARKRCVVYSSPGLLRLVQKDVHFDLATRKVLFHSSKHMPRKMRSMLEKCANPAKAKDGSRTAADDKIRKELYRMLKEIEDISEKIKDDG